MLLYYNLLQMQIKKKKCLLIFLSNFIIYYKVELKFKMV